MLKTLFIVVLHTSYGINLFSCIDSSDGGDEWPFSDSGMENVTDSDNQRIDGDAPMSPQPRPPSAGSQPKSPRTRRQRTLSQSTAAKQAVTTTNQVEYFNQLMFFLLLLYSFELSYRISS